MNLYTWHDVERELHRNFPDNWHEKWVSVDVYFDELIINVPKPFKNNVKEEFGEKLRDIFGLKYFPDKNIIKLDYDERELQVVYEEALDENRSLQSIPLFKKLMKSNGKPEKFKGVPVIAYHSYKGGVGRTLSMIASARSISDFVKEDGQRYKLLLVDADIEAPGLTWLAEKDGLDSDISLLDALSIVHETNNWREKSLPFLSKKIETNSISFPTEKGEVEHFFLSAYRDEDQIMDMPITPQNMVQMMEREWIIGNFLSELGDCLGVDAVLVDLRAGISEFAAPLLFDPRVRKVFVTSTNLQSRRGTRTVLERIYNTPIDPKYPKPTLFISKVPDELGNDKKIKIEKEFKEIFEVRDTTHIKEKLGEVVRNDLRIKFLPFTPGLVHLEGFESIDRNLIESRMLTRINDTVMEWFDIEEKDKLVIEEEERDELMEQILRVSEELNNFEKTLPSKFYKAKALQNLARKFRYTVPISVILGGLETGKTFTHMQLIKSLKWECFIKEFDHISTETETYIIPLLTSDNIHPNFTKMIKDRLKVISERLNVEISFKKIEKVKESIKEFSKLKKEKENEWIAFWREQIFSIFTNFDDYQGLQEYLESIDKRIVFSIEGLEDIFTNVFEDFDQQVAIRALHNGLVKELKSLPNSRIGLIAFIRKDQVINAFNKDWEKIYHNYEQYELKWTPLEVMRFMSWIIFSAKPDLFSDDITVEKLSKEITMELVSEVFKLPEPKYVRYFLANLSDVKLNFQTVDILLFIKNIVSLYTLSSQEAVYGGKLLFVTYDCAKAKVERYEDSNFLKSILDKFKNANKDERETPFNREDYGLTTKDIERLLQFNYIVQINNKYYLTDFLTNGLDFNSLNDKRFDYILNLYNKLEMQGF